jgi:hypothetical protein
MRRSRKLARFVPVWEVGRTAKSSLFALGPTILTLRRVIVGGYAHYLLLSSAAGSNRVIWVCSPAPDPSDSRYKLSIREATSQFAFIGISDVMLLW